MTDIVAAPVPDKVVVAPVVPDTPAPDTTPEYTETEQRAIDQGWNPDWEGPEDQKRSAREYLDRGELLSSLKAQSTEVKELRKMVQGLSEHNRKVYESGYERALNDLRAQKAKAVDDSDGALVVKLDEAIDQTREALRTVKQAPSSAPAVVEETQAFKDFKKANPVYVTSEKFKEWAHGAAISYAKRTPDATEEGVYEYISERARKEYPEHYGRRGPPSPDGEGRQSSAKAAPAKGGQAFEKLMADLPEDQANVARGMIKRGLMTKEKYVEDYERMGR